MDLILMTLTPPADRAAGAAVSPQTITDILWANTSPGSRIEHINVCVGPNPDSYTATMFVPRPTTDPPSAGPPAEVYAIAIRTCRSAIATSPVLAGWTASVYLTDLNLRP